jgi:hypothetical protein
VICCVRLIGMLTYRSCMSSFCLPLILFFYFCSKDIELGVMYVLGILILVFSCSNLRRHVANL